MPYWVEIEVENQTDKERVFTIPKGRMISPKDIKDKAQNLVTIKDVTVKVPPKGKVIVTVPTECTDPSYPAPNNTTMDVTVFGQRERPDNIKIFPGRSMQ
ncbi:MAG: hypothetical protein J7J52_03015 [Deltaproteobacteria bacterium]|nr:hypothetical protein [Deltaproteobacteria bacterium]